MHVQAEGQEGQGGQYVGCALAPRRVSGRLALRLQHVADPQRKSGQAAAQARVGGGGGGGQLRLRALLRRLRALVRCSFGASRCATQRPLGLQALQLAVEPRSGAVLPHVWWRRYAGARKGRRRRRVGAAGVVRGVLLVDAHLGCLLVALQVGEQEGVGPWGCLAQVENEGRS